jgi:hypothetical protein
LYYLEDNALLWISEFDQGRVDTRDLVVVVLSVRNDKFLIKTEYERVNRLLEPNVLEVTKCRAVTISEVDKEEHFVRELVQYV